MKIEQTKSCLMPARCMKCEEVFDTKEDFNTQEQIAEIECDLKSKEGVLCWDCRRIANAKPKLKKKR